MRMEKLESAKSPAQRAYVPYVSNVPYLATHPRVRVYFTDRKIKNIGFNEIK